MQKFVSWLFGHRRHWQHYKLDNKQHHMIFYCRRCKCGADQIQHHPLTSKEWKCRSIPAKFDWEQEWIDSATEILDS